MASSRQILRAVLYIATLCVNSVYSSSRAFHTEVFRRFAFPSGTFLIFTPELTIPTWRTEDPVFENGVGRSSRNDKDLACDREQLSSKSELESEDTAAFKNAAIQIASPFFVYFDKLGWTHEDSWYNTPQNVASYIQEYVVNPTLHIFGVPPRSQSAAQQNLKRGDTKKKRPSLSEMHRLQIFTKLEKLLEEIGARNGRACLLRTICELHEFPFETGRLGILGEVLALVLTVKRSENEVATSPCLSVYELAEKHGKARNCKMYAQHCKHSIFHWYWNMSDKLHTT